MLVTNRYCLLIISDNSTFLSVRVLAFVYQFRRCFYRATITSSKCNQKPIHAENGILVIARAILYHPVLQYVSHSFF